MLRSGVLLFGLLLWAPLSLEAQTAARAGAPAARAGSAVTTVVIVRHAEKEDEPRADPPLSAAGEARAQALADALKDAGVAAILVTPYERTRATARPLAALLGLTPEEVPVSRDIAAHIEAIVAVVRKHEGGTVLVVGHSNTVPLIAEALAATSVPAMTEAEYDRFVHITLGPSAPRLLTVRY